MRVNDELKEEWRRYLEETQSHVDVLEKICSAMKIDVARPTPGRSVVRHNGAGLVAAMKMAVKTGDRAEHLSPPIPKTLPMPWRSRNPGR